MTCRCLCACHELWRVWWQWVGAALPFTVEGDRINFTVPEVMGHQMVEINFA